MISASAIERMDENGRDHMEIQLESVFEGVHHARQRMVRRLEEMARNAADPERIGWLDPGQADVVAEYKRAEADARLVIKMFHTMMWAAYGREAREESKAYVEAVEQRIAARFSA